MKKIKLKDICEVFADGDWIEKKDQSFEGIRLLQTGNIKLGYYSDRKDKARFISEQTFKRLNCTEVLNGDILISRLPDPIGRACIIPNSDFKAITAVDCTIIRTKKDLVSSDFLNYYFQSSQYFFNVKKKVTGSTRRRISRKNLGEIEILLPSLENQKRIVTKLDKAFEEIDKIIKLTEENKNNVEAIFENKVKEFFAIDKNHSDLINLSEVASYFNGLTYSPKDTNDSGTIVLRSSNIKNGKMDFTDIVRVRKKISEKLYVRPNDILICSRNGSKRLIGKCSLIGKQKEQMTFGTFMMVIRSEANNYLKWFFKSKLFKQQISKGENTSINQITRYMLDEVLVPFPHKKTQVIISKKLKEIDSNVINLIDIYEQKIIQLKKLKSSLLRQELQQENVA